jgi:hypothetical protein
MFIITSNVLFYISIGLATILLILIIFHIRLELRLKKIFRGKNGQTIEGTLKLINQDIAGYKKFKSELEKYLEQVESRVRTSARGIETINFNAFSGAESGGKSFATAIINEKKDGIIISSLHARDRLSIFTKNIKGGISETPLSTEESEALTMAIKSCSLE